MELTGLSKWLLTYHDINPNFIKDIKKKEI